MNPRFPEAVLSNRPIDELRKSVRNSRIGQDYIRLGSTCKEIPVPVRACPSGFPGHPLSVDLRTTHSQQLAQPEDDEDSAAQ